jgi:ATP-dependent protease ClpP protease subunit
MNKDKNKNYDDMEFTIPGVSGVSVLNDHVYFYTEVTAESALELNKILQQVSMQMAPSAFSSMHEVNPPAPIWLHINSMGGDVFASFAIADTITRISKVIPIVTIVEGAAASGATIISIAGSKRIMRENAYMLVHELSDACWGKHSAMKDHLSNNEGIMKTIKKHYNKYTEIPEEEMDKILSRDIWWNAKKCKKYGLIDEII